MMCSFLGHAVSLTNETAPCETNFPYHFSASDITMPRHRYISARVLLKFEKERSEEQSVTAK
jgi:hypothetical protein